MSIMRNPQRICLIHALNHRSAKLCSRLPLLIPQGESAAPSSRILLRGWCWAAHKTAAAKTKLWIHPELSCFCIVTKAVFPLTQAFCNLPVLHSPVSRWVALSYWHLTCQGETWPVMICALQPVSCLGWQPHIMMPVRWHRGRKCLAPFLTAVAMAAIEQLVVMKCQVCNPQKICGYMVRHLSH